MADHIRATHENCNELACNVCNLFVCSVCGAYEGGLATECPGRRTTYEEDEAVYKGELDFRNGEWTKEHRSKSMYPQDEYCDICAGKDPRYERKFFTEDHKLWHRALTQADEFAKVPCNYSSATIKS